VTACLALFIPINYLTILSFIAVAGGLYFFFSGFRLLVRKRLLLSTPTSRIHSAALGLIEVNGKAVGPHTMPAPITGKPCFLYRTIAWQQRDGKTQEWDKVAEETLHLPFYIEDSTGQLLIEPLGADLDLLRDFREEYSSSFFSSNLADLPPGVSGFLSRHGVAAARSIRVEECLIKPEDPIFITGTLTENPGIQLRPPAPRGDPSLPDNDVPRGDYSRDLAPNKFSERSLAPQIVRLSDGSAASGSQRMGQQAKIVAALTRAGITSPAAWSAAGVPFQGIGLEQNGSQTAISAPSEAPLKDKHPWQEQPSPSGFDLTPPLVLMKGASSPVFVISFRSQKEFANALAWKSAAMLWGGAAITMLGLYVLLAQI
jgi:E3 Ubiquitin ligase